MNFSPKFILHIIYVSLIFVAFNNTAQAQFREFINKINNNSDDSIGTDYYTIADAEEDRPVLFSPLNTLKTLSTIEDILFGTQDSPPQEQNLLTWVLHENDNNEIPEKYQRKSHFGSWIRDPSHQTCLNIRGLILKRDALDDITYADARHCRITASRWIDPYTDTELYNAEDIQIDHVVPLKNAYISGAWQWSSAQRCNYANFIQNNFHLMAVLGTENSRKSDRTPEKYIPPKAEFVCQYLVNWLKIKSIWKLRIAKDEALAIEQELKTYDCNSKDFQLDWNELHGQRGKSFDFPETCDNGKPLRFRQF